MFANYKSFMRRFFIQAYNRVSIISVIICSISIILVYGLFNYMHIQTYSWQCTSLGETLSPVSRETCNFVESTSSQQKLRIGLLMMYDNKNGGWDNDLMSRVLKNREKYSQLHGYTMINANNLIDHTRPPAWSKLIAMEKHLASNQFDYLMYIDMDVVIMNPSIRLERFISPGADLVMTTDWNGLNTGVWLAKNTDWTKWFLRTAWEQVQLVQKKSPEGISYPFEYEQRAIHFLTDSEIWKKRKLPKYRGTETSAEINRHFHVVPQCAMNSYSLHPMDTRGDREVSQYVPGDFLVHFAGKKDQMKTDLMNHYLLKASRGEQ